MRLAGPVRDACDGAVIDALFEHAPRFLARLTAAGPFATDDALFETARTIAHAMPEDEQVELIDAHPRLGAPPGTVSAFSFREQGYDRAEAFRTGRRGRRARAPQRRVRDAVRVPLLRVRRGPPREALLPGMTAALDADRDAELHRALDAVVDIARDRYAKLSADI